MPLRDVWSLSKLHEIILPLRGFLYSNQNPSAMQSPTDGEVTIHHFAVSGVMDVVTTLIGVLDIKTRNKSHKDPETSSG